MYSDCLGLYLLSSNEIAIFVSITKTNGAWSGQVVYYFGASVVYYKITEGRRKRRTAAYCKLFMDIYALCCHFPKRFLLL